MASTKDIFGISEYLFYGKYSHLRRELDFNYHGSYSQKRTLIQDKIIDTFLGKLDIGELFFFANLKMTPEETKKPRLIFSGGVMGAGKSHTLKWMHENKQINLDEFLWVDPDKIKELIPEYDTFKKEDPFTAGSRLHHESGYIQEILVLLALKNGWNIIVDGSLKDHVWYSWYFGIIRSHYPNYKLEIIYVVANVDIIWKRINCRAAETGRYIPPSVFQDNLEQVPKSIDVLRKLVDKIMSFVNNNTPKLMWQAEFVELDT